MTLKQIKNRLIRELSVLGLNNNNIQFTITDVLNMIITGVRNTESDHLSTAVTLSSATAYDSSKRLLTFNLPLAIKPHRVIVNSLNGTVLDNKKQLINTRSVDDLLYIHKPSYYYNISGSDFKMYTNLPVNNTDWNISLYYISDSFTDSYEFDNINIEGMIINYVKGILQQNDTYMSLFNKYYFQFSQEIINTHINEIPSSNELDNYKL